MMIKSLSMLPNVTFSLGTQQSHRVLFALFFLVLATLACSATDLDLLTAESGSVLFSDDFSDRSGGWSRVSNEGGIVGYDNGVFRILVNAPGYNYWATPGLNFADTRIEVETGHFAGPVSNRLGLVCRYQDDRNYYFFVISSDGFYAVGKVSGGETIHLGQAEMQSSQAIKTDDPVNHLRADCIGDTLTFFVNGFPVALVHDDQFARGDVGLLAGAFEETGVDIIFDDFVVYKP